MALKAVAALQQQQGAPGELVAARLRQRAQRMAFRRGEHVAVLEQGRGREVADLEGQRDQDDVEPTGPEALDQAFGQLLAQEQAQVGKGLAQPRKGAGDQERTDRRDRAEPQVAAEHAGVARGDVGDVLRVGQQAAGAIRDLRADRGQRDAAFRALGERDAEGLLQLLQPRAQRGLGDVAGLGRAAEMELVGQCDEKAELAQARRDH